MAPQSVKMRLDHTAALVTSWAAPLYEHGPAAAFVGQLDLSNGQELLARCHDVCPWYGEVIRDRKHFLRHRIQRELTSRAEQYQVVIRRLESPPSRSSFCSRSPTASQR